MAFRPIGRIIFRIKYIYDENNNKSGASLKRALPKDLEGHSQKLLLSLGQKTAPPRHRSFS